MRALIGGVIGAVVFAGAAWALADVTDTTGSGGPYQIYIYDDADQPTVHLYAFAVGERATAARVENCDGIVLDNAHDIVADLRRRARSEDRDFNVITVDGEGSSTHLGRCSSRDHDEDDDPESEGDRSDSLIVLRGASASQARHLINEIHGLSREERAAMTDALGLNRPARGRR
jgi:hypothetical protein